MCTTNGKWVVSLLQSIDFIKAKVKKQRSSSTLPITCTIANLANFTYLETTQISISQPQMPSGEL